MSPLVLEFAQIAVAHALAVASPGPDFALVLRQSLAHDRRTAVWTALGIGSGILVHVTYSVLGIGLLLTQSVAAFTVLKVAGAAYLAWLGVGILRAARPRDPGLLAPTAAARAGAAPARGAAWRTGFLTNALNPKATLFFLALFPTVVSASTPRAVQVGYGLWMAAATAAWFSLVGCVFTQAGTRRAFLRWSHWIDRLLGVVFLGFAAGLLLTRAGGAS